MDINISNNESVKEVVPEVAKTENRDISSESIMPQEASKEAQTIQEQPISVPVPDPVAVNADNQALDQATINEETGITKKDVPWVKKAKEVIAKFRNKPYEETEASEDLEIEYLDKRFGVKVKDNDK